MTEAQAAASMKRRQFLKLAAGAAFTGASASLLASCQPQDKPEDSGGGEGAAGTPAIEYDSVVRSVCSPNCVGSCGVNVFVKDDTIVKIEPGEYPDDAYRRVCLRGISNALQRVYSADRVKYPMRRVGERGAGEWERITWEEAIDTIYEKMQANIEAYGPTSNAFFGMSGNYGTTSQKIDGMMAATYDATSFSNLGIMADNAATMGFYSPLGVFQEANCWDDLIGSKTIMMFGCNYAESLLNDMHFVFDAQEAGASLVVVDPRFSRTAAKADWWVPIRPGTDAALAMGMMNHIVGIGAHDEAYIRAYSTGAFLVDTATGKFARSGENYLVWDESAGAAVPIAALPAGVKPTYPSVACAGDIPDECVVPETAALYGEFAVEADGASVTAKPAFQLIVESLEPYTPEAASAICEVPAEDIVRLAEMYVNEGPCSLRVSQGLNRYYNGCTPFRALIQLAAITGNIGKEHANINWANGTLIRFPAALSPEMATPYPGHKAQAMYGTRWIDQVSTQQPWPIKLLWTHIYGWGTQGPDWNRVVNEALPNLDFLIVSEQVMTDAALYADLVLPVTSYYEEPFDIIGSWTSMHLQVREQAISQQWEAKTDYQVAQMLAERFGILEDTLWALEPKELLRTYAVEGSLIPEFNTMDFDELVEKKVLEANFPEHHIAFKDLRFPTASGKIELYVESLSDFGEATATFYEPVESNRSEKAATYPLTFMNTHSAFSTHSQHTILPWINELAPEPRLEISPTDADARGIKTGDLVEVFNDRGSYQVKALVTPQMKPGCLNQFQGWWSRHFPEGHYSTLLHMTFNPAQDAVIESNFSPYDTLVDVRLV